MLQQTLVMRKGIRTRSWTKLAKSTINLQALWHRSEGATRVKFVTAEIQPCERQFS